jgi:hypothetical protein
VPQPTIRVEPTRSVPRRLASECTGIINDPHFLLECDVPCTLSTASLTDWVPNFTKPFLAVGPEIFGNDGSVTVQAERHDHFSPSLLDLRGIGEHFYTGAAQTAGMALVSLEIPLRSQNCRVESCRITVPS